MKVLLATSNRNKISEFRDILKEDGIEVVGLPDMPEELNVEETGQTFLENAILKARAAFEKFGIPTAADDSGLEVEALENRPGVLSSRFAGENATDEENNAKLISLLKDVPDGKRTARFVCLAVFFTGEKEVSFAEGWVDGVITREPRGTNGFGYDPLFLYQPLKKTFAELSAQEKNKISHRKKAIHAIRYKILEFKKALPDGS
ncbi:MAG: XTP/dITP diphosphatase [Candidatus Aureabacteria bacterium]|nr:XTP/dITP diphosphatase [Candidatus Auribacterota bacterium]